MEQAGNLKRRRIEGIQYCLEAMETVGGADDRDRCRSADMVRTVAFGGPTSSTDTQSDKEICIREVINAAGRSKEGLDCKVGKLAKQLYVTDHPEYVFPKKQIYADGQLISVNIGKKVKGPTLNEPWLNYKRAWSLLISTQTQSLR